MGEIIALYADGGVILKNPSTIGGTWAWCAVDADGNRVIERGGAIAAKDGYPITNNHMEQIAVTLALEAMPDGWSGKVYSDSMVALGRVFKGWRIKNLPLNVAKRSAAAVARLGAIETVLLQGHPTKADLASGIGKKRNLPVSIQNVWCDAECGRQAKAFLEQRESAPSPCGSDCDHTVVEHYAFDQGVGAGENGVDEEENPYGDGELSEAWLSGYSVGVLNAEVAA